MFIFRPEQKFGEKQLIHDVGRGNFKALRRTKSQKCKYFTPGLNNIQQKGQEKGDSSEPKKT